MNSIVSDELVRELHMFHEETADHVSRVERLAVTLGSALELDRDELDLLEEAARLHDVGKLFADRESLDRKGRLSEGELEEIRRHPDQGAMLVGRLSDGAEIADIIRAHHERFDGRGYPEGLEGEEIPFLSRIIAVADSFDAMMTRTYNGKRSEDEVLAELDANAGTQFDPRVVETFLSLSDVRPMREIERHRPDAEIAVAMM